MNFRQIHLDFHTSEAIPGVGLKFSKEQFQEALKAGHVNSITVFSKCHHGYAYHPSNTNEMHPGLDFDLLGAQIEAAHEIGVKTPVYLSAGHDQKILKQHPEWRGESKDHCFNNFTEPGYHLCCFNTPYLDYLLAQIKEVVENYDADGIFLDIVGVRMCYCNKCIKDMITRGMNPANPADVLKLGEEVYANYLKKVRETIDSVKPGLPVFHNSGHIRHGRRDLAYGNTHLELESLPTGGWGYDHFPISASYVQNLGMDFLGMTGKFHTHWGEFGGFKHPNALIYETALNAAFGAKTSVGDQMHPNGHMDMTTYNIVGKAFEQLEEKEPWLDNTSPVCDIAVLSVEGVSNEYGAFNEGIDLMVSDTGVGRILIEGKYLFSIVDKYVDLSQYKVLILPDSIILKGELKEKVDEFVRNGGKLLATGDSGISENGDFIYDFGAKCEGISEFCPSYVHPLWDNDAESDYIMYTPCRKVTLTDGEELAKMVEPYFNRTAEHFCSHQHAPSSGTTGGAGMCKGKDGIYIAWKIFEDYATKGELIAKTVVLKALDTLLGNDKSLETNLGSMGVATLREQKDESRYIAHLLYAVPTKRGKNIEIIEDIYPVYNIDLSIKIPTKVKKAYLAPQNVEIPFEEKDGRISIKIEKLDCHQMVVFDV